MRHYNKTNIKFLSILSYIGPLFIIGKFSYEKNSDQVSFHCKQGELLFYIMTILILISITFDHFLTSLLESFSVICFLFKIGIIVTWIILSIMGIVSAFFESKTKLPIVGNLYDKFNNKKG